MKFKNIEIGQEVYGLVYGKGKIVDTFVDGFYEFMVLYSNGYEVPYTSDGVPGWGTLSIQTVFYPEDIDVMRLDHTPSEEKLKPKKIIKLRNKGILEAKCPSGNWINIKECPGSLIEQYLEQEKFFLFRKEL